jgi:hypothetical protein
VRGSWRVAVAVVALAPILTAGGTAGPARRGAGRAVPDACRRPRDHPPRVLDDRARGPGPRRRRRGRPHGAVSTPTCGPRACRGPASSRPARSRGRAASRGRRRCGDSPWARRCRSTTRCDRRAGWRRERRAHPCPSRHTARQDAPGRRGEPRRRRLVDAGLPGARGRCRDDRQRPVGPLAAPGAQRHRRLGRLSGSRPGRAAAGVCSRGALRSDAAGAPPAIPAPSVAPRRRPPVAAARPVPGPRPARGGPARPAPAPPRRARAGRCARPRPGSRAGTSGRPPRPGRPGPQCASGPARPARRPRPSGSAAAAVARRTRLAGRPRGVPRARRAPRPSPPSTSPSRHPVPRGTSAACWATSSPPSTGPA